MRRLIGNNKAGAGMAWHPTRGHLIATALAAAASLGMSSAWAGPCVPGTVASYEVAGFSCNVNGVTFSQISVTPIVANGGVVALGDFAPVTFTVGGVNEYGLELTYSADAFNANSSADVAWTYNVAGVPSLSDAYMVFTGTVTGTGTATLSETLSNGVTLSLNGPGATSATFAPVGNLSVIKDQNDFAGTKGSSETSILENAWSIGPSLTTPEPASLTLLGTALFGLGWFTRRRKGV